MRASSSEAHHRVIDGVQRRRRARRRRRPTSRWSATDRRNAPSCAPSAAGRPPAGDRPTAGTAPWPRETWPRGGRRSWRERVGSAPHHRWTPRTGPNTLYQMVHLSAELLDQAFGALADANRREILDHVAHGPVSISALATPLDISLPGVLKHVRVLEDAELVVTRKIGRVRLCELHPRPLHEVAAWVEARQRRWDSLLDRFAAHLAAPESTSS